MCPGALLSIRWRCHAAAPQVHLPHNIAEHCGRSYIRLACANSRRHSCPSANFFSPSQLFTLRVNKHQSQAVCTLHALWGGSPLAGGKHSSKGGRAHSSHTQWGLPRGFAALRTLVQHSLRGGPPTFLPAAHVHYSIPYSFRLLSVGSPNLKFK